MGQKKFTSKKLSNQFSESVKCAEIPPDICLFLLGIWSVLLYKCIIINSSSSIDVDFDLSSLISFIQVRKMVVRRTNSKELMTQGMFCKPCCGQTLFWRVLSRSVTCLVLSVPWYSTKFSVSTLTVKTGGLRNDYDNDNDNDSQELMTEGMSWKPCCCQTLFWRVLSRSVTCLVLSVHWYSTKFSVSTLTVKTGGGGGGSPR